MISLRQHAISLIAVFAALIIGLFLGTGFLGDKMNSLTGTSRDRIGDLNDQLDEANAARNASDGFAHAVAPRLLHEQLDGRSVIVVTAPNAADDDVTAVKESMSAAGARFTGQLGLTTELLRDREAEKLRSIIDQSIPPGKNLRPELTDSGGRLGDLLGLLLQTGAGRGNLPAAQVTTALTTLRDGGFIDYTDRAVAPAQLVVIVTGGAFPADSGAQGQLVGRLAGAFAARGLGGVLAGRVGSAKGGSPIAVVRSDPSLGNSVATVDNVNQPIGRITTVLALRASTQGKPAAYGIGAGATAITPPA
ncbi:putative channel protein [Gordonia araii NBRC 100433]|uniref:Putative channel protein n=1 Tax=Gordonia araii NBRC 100433 TaxID=1073574 RepID=G7GXN8_9ACTN|nr:copper transporter [Gordonia araii]NNG99127.1 copper transporter [Gordonia araii NBRC 100433]GAB08363.1 putative channel protein [Gordonia araii NBRC 100433]